MSQTSPDAAEYEAATETPFRIEAPRIPSTEFHVRAYGAKGDGAAKDTAAIQDAVDDASAKGGGTVVVPAGSYLSGTIVLRSRIRLRLEKGALLLGSLDLDDYSRSDRWPALLLAADAEDIAVEGGGALDGRGRELAVAMADLRLTGKRPELRYSEQHGRVSEADRPQLLEFRRCARVAVSGVLFKDSAGWVQTYSLCRDLSIRGVRVDSDAFWNNDGIDVDDCRNVLVEDCDVDSADDGICLKSEVASAGCENIVIRRCRVRSSASAVKFGTASHGGFRNIAVRDISVYDTFRSAIALESDSKCYHPRSAPLPALRPPAQPAQAPFSPGNPRNPFRGPPPPSQNPGCAYGPVQDTFSYHARTGYTPQSWPSTMLWGMVDEPGPRLPAGWG